MSSPCDTPSSEATVSEISSTSDDSQATLSYKSSLVTNNREIPSSPAQSSQRFQDYEGSSSPPVTRQRKAPSSFFSSSSSPISTGPILQSVEQDDYPVSNPMDSPLPRDLFSRMMRPAAQLMISPNDPTLTPSQQYLKHRQELCSHVPFKVQKTMHSVRTTRLALIDPNRTATSPPPWLKNLESKFLSQKWPRILEHHRAITTAAEKQSRLRQLELELQTPEARSVLRKLKERGALKKDICLSYTDLVDQMLAEDPDLRDMLFELYRQEVGEDLLEPHSPPDPPGFSAVLDDLLYEESKDPSQRPRSSNSV